MTLSRRDFVKRGLRAAAAAVGVPGLARAALAGGPPGKRLVVVFLRGAIDGLNVVVPHGDPGYYALRPSIAVPRDQVLDLDGCFGLHPALASLAPLYRGGHLALVHAAGSPDPTRSHFDAQDYMESGTPGVKSTPDGWLDRCGRRVGCGAAPLCAVSAGSTVPRILAGPGGSFALGTGTRGGRDAREEQAVRAMYERSLDAPLREEARQAFLASARLGALEGAGAPPPGGGGALGQALPRLARLLRADPGIRLAFADAGGWDHHVNEGGAEGQLANRLRELAGALERFWEGLGDAAGETVLVALSEFGRTARENGSRGTDHGHGNVMLVLGGPVRGGAVYGRWPGLAPEQLHEGRDLAVTTDFRLVLAEVVDRHLGCDRVDAVFPGYAPGPAGYLGLLG